MYKKRHLLQSKIWFNLYLISLRFNFTFLFYLLLSFTWKVSIKNDLIDFKQLFKEQKKELHKCKIVDVYLNDKYIELEFYNVRKAINQTIRFSKERYANDVSMSGKFGIIPVIRIK